MSLSESGDESGSWSGSGSGRVWGLTTTTHSDIRGPRRHHGTDDTTGTDRHPRRHHGTDDTTGTDRHRDGEAAPPTADRRPSLWDGLWEGRVWGLTDGGSGRDTGKGRLHRPPASTHHSFIIKSLRDLVLYKLSKIIKDLGEARDGDGTGRLHRPPPPFPDHS